MKKITAFTLVLIMLIGMIPASIAATPVNFAGKVSAYVGDTTRWTANQWVWWTSGNTSVATIDQTGTIKALKAGKTHITGTAADGAKKTITFVVYNRPGASVSTAQTAVTLSGKTAVYVGDTFKWTANQWVWWTSGNTSVATIDQTGTIKALKAGKTNITATAANGAKKTITLLVYNKPVDKTAKKNSYLALFYQYDAEREYVGETAYTTYDMRSGLGENFRKWDALLNDVYKFLKTILTPAEFSKLEKEEIAWIKRKDAAVKAAGAEFEGGSLQPVMETDAAITWTRERCLYLIYLIK